MTLNAFPVLLDSRPEYMVGAPVPASLLLAPLGRTTLGSRLATQVRRVTPVAPMVVTTFEIEAGYEFAVRDACASVRSVETVPAFADRLQDFDPSDWLFIVDPRCFPEAGLDANVMTRHPASDPRWVRHLVALERSPVGTQECVELGDDGRVRRIRRYYDGVTWPFTTGVACSLVPVASALRLPAAALASLAELRRALACAGVPSRDLPLTGSYFDLTRDEGLLALCHKEVLEAQGPGAGPADGQGRRSTNQGSAAAAESLTPDVTVGMRCDIHPSARVIGPVVLQDGVVLEEDAIVLGPALLAAGVRVGAEAVVAQSLVGPGLVIPPNWIVRHGVMFRQPPSAVPAVRDEGVMEYRPPPPEGTTSADWRHPQRTLLYPRVKTMGDKLIAVASLVALAPLFAVIAALIKLDSRGPALFGHKREGLAGRAFKCWKFRTMVLDADVTERELRAQNEVDGPQFKLDRDPRVTRTGRYLRPSSLDELPQLFNVALGEMSLVGPRPSPFRENQICVPWREGRLSVRPGITGLWQVCRQRRQEGDFHQWIDYDLLYVRHLSLWLDLKILVATVASLGGKFHIPVTWILSESEIEEAA